MLTNEAIIELYKDRTLQRQLVFLFKRGCARVGKSKLSFLPVPKSEIDDCMQETWLLVMKTRDKYNQPVTVDDPKAWMYQWVLVRGLGVGQQRTIKIHGKRFEDKRGKLYIAHPKSEVNLSGNGTPFLSFSSKTRTKDGDQELGDLFSNSNAFEYARCPKVVQAIRYVYAARPDLTITDISDIFDVGPDKVMEIAKQFGLKRKGAATQVDREEMESWIN